MELLEQYNWMIEVNMTCYSQDGEAYDIKLNYCALFMEDFNIAD